MRSTLPLLALAFALPASLLAQTIVVKGAGGKEDRIAINDPFAPASTKIDPAKGVWNSKGITYSSGEMVLTKRTSDILAIDWGKNEPGPMKEARDYVARGNPTKALPLIEPVLRQFDPVRKVKGSLWLKAAEIKLDALSGLSNTATLGAFIAVLEENDDGSVPGLAAKLKLARLTQRVRAEDHAGVLVECQKLLTELIDPESQARLHLIKGDSLLATRKYDEALDTYLRIPVFYGAEKSALPTAYLGAAKALRYLDTPVTREQRLDLVAAEYLRQVIRDFPASKEAVEAKSLLPREERIAEEKRSADEINKPAEEAASAAAATPPAQPAAPAAE